MKTNKKNQNIKKIKKKPGKGNKILKKQTERVIKFKIEKGKKVQIREKVIPNIIRNIIHLNTWPTLEQGAISIVPPHIQALKLSSKFSPPQTSMPSSKNPSSSKKSLRMAKSPPANIGFSWEAQILGFLARSFASNSCLE